MSDTTKIEWCDHSWSPWEGCTKVSPGCLNCYAEEINARFRKGANWGKGAPRRLTVDWRKPVKWDSESLAHWDNARGKGIPLSLPPRHKVFPSVCDWLDDEVPIEWLARFLQLIHDTPNLDWLLLTKRPENFDSRTLAACQLLSESITAATAPMVRWLIDWRRGFEAPRNVWIGTSVEDQQRADERVPALLKIPARVRFLSVEPLLGPVDLFLDWLAPFKDTDAMLHRTPRIDWVIVGGESGRNARPCNVGWVRSIVWQCHGSEVPCFVKQLGARAVLNPCRQHHFDWRHGTSNAERPDDKLFSEDGCVWKVLLTHPKGGDPAEWPEHLRVRQFPEVTP